MKYLYLLPLGLALVTVSCKNKTTTASTNPYQNNPYYGPSGTSYGSSTSDYSSSSSSSSSYPSYSQNTYTPPSVSGSSSVNLPSVPEAPSYSAPSYVGPAASNSAPSVRPYTGASGGGTHRVNRGDNLYRISLKYGTSVSAIKQANGLYSDTIHPGQTLRIP